MLLKRGNFYCYPRFTDGKNIESIFLDYIVISKKKRNTQAITVNAPAFVPACRSALVTRAFHGPVVAPAGILTVQVILFALATVMLVAERTVVLFRS